MYWTSEPKKVLLIWSLLLHISVFCSAQIEQASFHAVSVTDLNLKECAFDKNADAVILLDSAVSYFDEQYALITDRRIRLKILKEKGIQRGDISIPYYSRNNFEYITDLQASVVTPEEGGTLKMSVLEKKNVYYKQINGYYSAVRFALPNVNVGSIIDYRYRSVAKSYAGLDSWKFQSDLPVIKSSFELAPIPNSEFAYSVYKKSDYRIHITQNKEAGKTRYEMYNIPGLRDEVYSTSYRNYLQRVNFQFASYKDYYGKQTYTSTWAELANELISERAFGVQMKKDLSGTSLLKSLPAQLSPQEKLRAIHDYVRKNIVWDFVSSKYSEAGVKATLDKKKGNSGEINLLLISLLKSAGLEVYPMLVSERDHGKVDTSYSFLDQFNKVVAYVKLEDASYILDGTDSYTPFFMVPQDLLNTVGFIVDKKKLGFVYLRNLPHRQREAILLTGRINEDGTMTGNARVAQLEYAKVAKERLHKSDKARYREALLKDHPYLKVDSFEVEGLTDDSAALTHQLTFRYDLQKTGGYFLLNYNLFSGLTGNPFITQHRFSDIDFGAKYTATITGSFSLPASLVAEALPANKTLVSPDRSLSVSRVMEKSGDKINMRVHFEINRESYAPEEYETIRGFFKELVDLLNEPVLLKSK